MSGIGLYAFKNKPLGGVDKLGKLKKFLIGVHTASFHSDLIFHKAVYGGTGVNGCLGQRPDVVGVINAYYQIAFFRQLSYPFYL